MSGAPIGLNQRYLGRRCDGIGCQVRWQNHRRQPRAGHPVGVEELVGPLRDQHLWHAARQCCEHRAAAAAVHDEIDVRHEPRLIDKRLDMDVVGNRSDARSRC